MDGDRLLLYLRKGNETYVVMYDEDQTAEAYRTIARWAHSTELSFDWADAARLSIEIRNNAQELPNLNSEIQTITPARQLLALMLCDLKHGGRRQVEYDGLEADMCAWIEAHGEPTYESVQAWVSATQREASNG